MKKILVPTDFSKSAQMAVDVAADIAKKANAELIVLHVVEDVGGESFNVEAQIEMSPRWEDKIFMMKLLERTKKQLAKVTEELKASGVKVKQELRLGTPFHGMRTITTEQKVDLV